MGKAAKSTKKFAASGQLKKTIQARRKHQQTRKKLKSRVVPIRDDEESEEDGPVDSKRTMKGSEGETADNFLPGFIVDGDESEGDDQELDTDGEASSIEDEFDDGDSIASADDLDEGENHLFELAKLAETDPEFYKYLQENDRELLEFDPDAPMGGDDYDTDRWNDEAGEKLPVLTMDTLQKWQKALLEHRSLRTLRKLLIAFRSAAYMHEEGQVLTWTIDSPLVYNKLVTTTLRYTPVIIQHHIPFRTLPNGKMKPPVQSDKLKRLQKLMLGFFHNVIHMLSQLNDNEMVRLSITESTKLVPYIVGSRKAVKQYLKICLDLWSNAADSIRIAALVAIRVLTSSTDDSIADIVLKRIYLTLVRSSKATTASSLPSINFMKNSASEIFCINQAMSYQHAFGYIRQLAIHLRNSIKVKTKEAHKQVYNWQFVHCVDFWAIVLASACDTQTEVENGCQESELKPLIYPLVQIGLGAIKLTSAIRFAPFHFQIIRSLLHLANHTHTYIPISPYLLPILTLSLSSSHRPKQSTIRPPDFEVQIRAPQQYLKTRVYAECLVEETIFLLAEWLASRNVQGSIAFPEVIVPVVVTLRKALKNSKSLSKGSGKELGIVKGLVERIEESSNWVELKRKTAMTASGGIMPLEIWDSEMKTQVDDSPLGRYVQLMRKTREKRRKLVAKAREEEDRQALEE